MMEASDYYLLGRAARGDRDAFAALYDRHAPTVYGLLLKVLRCRDDADDVLQEVFLQAWRQVDHYDASRASVAGWLVLLARSRGLDCLRRRRRTANGAAVEPAEPAEAAATVEQRETAAQVEAALAELPPEQRDALTLAFYSGLTHQQVAGRQGVPLGTAKTRIRLAMGRLRQVLEHLNPVSAS